MKLMTWPIPALLAWGSSWMFFTILQAMGLPESIALLAAAVWGGFLSQWGNTFMRKALVVLGFPLSVLASSSTLSVPPWIWLGLVAIVALVCSALVACGGTQSAPSTTPTGDASGTSGVERTPTSDPVAGTTTVVSTASSAPRGTTTTAPTHTTVPTCANPADRGAVTVLAASSMVNVLDELKDAWMSSHPCVTAVNISYGSSATLAAQVVSGAPADVFISASDATMNTVRNAGLAVIAPQVFARNKGAILLWPGDRKSTRLNSSHTDISRMPSSA